MVRILRRQILVFGLLAGLANPCLAAEAFVTGIEDLPLMPGLQPLTAGNVVFDAPGGRVVEAWAAGSASREAVLAFYTSTLPQLGWTQSTPSSFRREGELLQLEFPTAGPQGARAPGGLVVRFYLSPG
jgi:hypothetical protein